MNKPRSEKGVGHCLVGQQPLFSAARETLLPIGGRGSLLSIIHPVEGDVRVSRDPQPANLALVQASSLTVEIARSVNLQKLDAMNWFELSIPLQIPASSCRFPYDVRD